MSIIFLDEVDSTNQYARDNLESIADGTLVVAWHQTAGRGRLGRVWQSPPRTNVCASMVMKRCSNGFLAVVALSLGVLDTLREFAPEVGFWIKWPNDIYCGDKKICGILCESRSVDNHTCIIGGMGININMTPEQLAMIDQKATSISAETGSKINLENFVTALEKSLIKRYIIYARDCKMLLAEWKTENLLLNKTIEISSANEVLKGKVAGFADSGEMLLEVDGVLRLIHSGDVHINRDTIDF